MSDYRIFVLLAWEPRLGAFVTPVGVLGVPADGLPYVSWVPLIYEAARPWQRRFTGPVTRGLIDLWVSAGQMAEVAAPDPPVPMREAVEELLDQLVVGVIPVLHASGR